MSTLEERYLASYPVLARLGRVDADGLPLPSPMMAEVAPDLRRIIGEACFGTLWVRPSLSIEQRSLATISVITVLRRDENLRGHIESGLDVGLSAEQIVEVMLQLLFYTGAPIANTGLRISYDVFKDRGIKVEPIEVYDTNEDPEELYRRGLEKRREVMGDSTTVGPGGDDTDRDWYRYLIEYLWGSIWTRPGLDLQSRCICVLAALTEVGTEQTIRNYVGAALHLGLTENQVKELFFHLTFYTGFPRARRASTLADEVFKSR